MCWIARSVFTCLTFSGLLTLARSAEPPDVIVGGLQHPCGVAVQPNTAQVFVSERALGRVVRVVEGQLQEVLVGLPRGTRELTPPVDPGPLDLTFLDAETLAVSGAEQAGGAAILYVAPVPQIGADPLPAGAALALPVADPAAAGPLRLLSVTTNGSTVFCAVRTADGRGGIGTISLQNASQLNLAASYQAYQPLTEMRAEAVWDYPVSLVIAPRGELVVAQRNRQADAVDNQLAFYRATDGKRLLQLPTGLSSLTDLAYGARRGGSTAPLLYALDQGGSAANGGGLYRLDATFDQRTVQIQATQIAALDRPSAMALGGDGSLYVTVLGAEQPDDAQPVGQLLRFPPGL